ncbi:MAG: peptidyl-tRNA hydrolase Pth2 [Candidatus Thermoplasmatota archaeon]
MKETKNSQYKMVIVVRTDLKLTPGKLSAQVAHAAVDCALATKKNKTTWFNEWKKTGSKKAVLKAEKEGDFYILKERAEELGLTAIIIEDAGYTEIPAGTRTVLGIGPGPEELIDKVTGELPLL